MRTLIREIRRLGDPNRVADLLLDGGVIESIDTPLGVEADLVLDGNGGLALPAFVNTHVHLDKCLTAGEAPPGAVPALDESVRQTWRVKRSYSVEGIIERAGRAVRSALSHGTTTIRAFADVDPIGGLVPVEGLCALRDTWRDHVTIEVVAFPQEGIVRAPGTEELMREAMRVGADVVGGMPWFEFSDEDARRHVDICLDLAEALGKDVHMLVDDTDDPQSRSLEYLALQTDRRNFHGRVAASHCGALAAYDDAHAARVIDLVAKANISVVSNSHISLVFSGRHDHGRIRRGITRVRELRDAGINVAAAQDDVSDPYYPFGRNDQLEVAQYMCHVAKLISPADTAYAIKMVTSNSAQAMRLTDYGLRQGCRADVVVYRAPNATEALRLMEPPRYVVRNGTLVAENELRQSVTGLRQPPGR